MPFLDKYLLYIKIGAVLAAILFGWWVRGLYEAPRRLAAINSAVAAVTEKCEKDKAITRGVNDALQRDRDSIRARLASLKRLPSACIVPTAGEADAGSGGAGHARKNVSSTWLLDYAGECEGYRRTVVSLDKFLDDERR